MRCLGTSRNIWECDAIPHVAIKTNREVEVAQYFWYRCIAIAFE